MREFQNGSLLRTWIRWNDAKARAHTSARSVKTSVYLRKGKQIVPPAASTRQARRWWHRLDLSGKTQNGSLSNGNFWLKVSLLFNQFLKVSNVLDTPSTVYFIKPDQSLRSIAAETWLQTVNPVWVETAEVDLKHSERSAHVRRLLFFPLTAASSLSGKVSFIVLRRQLPSSSLLPAVVTLTSLPSLPSPPPSLPPFIVSSRPADVSQPTEAEQRGDEHPERHQDGKHEAAVVGCVRVRCSGARLDPVLGTRWELFLPTFLASLALLLFFLLFLVLLQAGVRLKLWHIC